MFHLVYNAVFKMFEQFQNYWQSAGIVSFVCSSYSADHRVLVLFYSFMKSQQLSCRFSSL